MFNVLLTNHVAQNRLIKIYTLTNENVKVQPKPRSEFSNVKMSPMKSKKIVIDSTRKQCRKGALNFH